LYIGKNATIRAKEPLIFQNRKTDVHCAPMYTHKMLALIVLNITCLIAMFECNQSDNSQLAKLSHNKLNLISVIRRSLPLYFKGFSGLV